VTLWRTLNGRFLPHVRTQHATSTPLRHKPPQALPSNMSARLNPFRDKSITSPEVMMRRPSRLRSVESNYQNVLSELVNFQRNMAQQDGVMQNLIQYFLNIENGKLKTEALIAARNGTSSDPAFGGSTSADSESNPFVPAQEAQRMIGGLPRLTSPALRSCR
jgi:hypothetical protein